MIRTAGLILAALAMLFGCASVESGDGEPSPQQGQAGTETPASTAGDPLPLVLDSDADLRRFAEDFSFFVEEAAQLHEDLITEPFEEHVGRIEELRGDLDGWRRIQEQTILNAESQDITAEAFDQFVGEMNAMNGRLRRVVFQINREIAEATGGEPIAE